MNYKYIWACLFMIFIMLTSCAHNVEQEQDIHRAAYGGKIDRVKSYIEAGGKIDTLDEYEMSLANYAAEGGHMNLVNILLAKYDKSRTKSVVDDLMYSAVVSKNVRVVDSLVAIGGNVNYKNDKVYASARTPLLMACRNLDYEMMEYLVSKGADVNTRSDYGATPLKEVVYLSNTGGEFQYSNGNPLKCVKFLLRKGASVNTADEDGSTPLALATSEGQVDIVKFLVKKGADIHKRGKDGETALTYAAGRADRNLFEYFIKQGANPKQRLNDGSTVLMKAVGSNDTKFVKYVLDEYSFDVADKSKSGENMLMYAVFHSDESMIEYIINELHVDVNSVDNNGISPLMIAAGMLNLDKIKLLLKYKADVNDRDKKGATPLIHSAMNARVDDSFPREDYIYDLVKFLISQGADKNIKDSSGKLALDYVAGKQMPDTIDILE